MTQVQIVGRSSSHYTRVALIFAHELEVAFEFIPIHDLTSVEPAAYAGNPALKLPILRREGAALFGAENICRALAELSAASKRVVWPEQLRSDLARNAQELVEHCMAAQVQWIFGTMFAKLPRDNVYFEKGRSGFVGALGWLDEKLASVLQHLPTRDVSLFEVMLFCLVEHLSFRGTMPVEPYPSLARFAAEFAQRESAQRTQYRYDTK